MFRDVRDKWSHLICWALKLKRPVVRDVEKHDKKINVDIKGIKNHKNVKTCSVTGVVVSTLRLSG